MKTLKLLFLALCLASFPLVTGMTCGSTTARVTYTSLYSTGLAVNSAFAAYSDLLVRGQVSTNGFPEISRDYQAFQSLYGAAISAAQLNPSAPTPLNVTDAAAKVTGGIAAAKKGKK